MELVVANMGWIYFAALVLVIWHTIKRALR